MLLPLLALSSSSTARAAAAALSKMSFTTQRSGGTITISPKNEADQSGLIVISHGLGDSAEGFVDVAEVGCLLLLLLHFSRGGKMSFSRFSFHVKTDAC